MKIGDLKHEADARLTAAAPELLTALKFLVARERETSLTSYAPPGQSCTDAELERLWLLEDLFGLTLYRAACRAIAKAEGRKCYRPQEAR